MFKEKFINLLNSLEALEDATKAAESAAQEFYEDQVKMINDKLVLSVKKRYWLIDRDNFASKLVELREKAGLSRYKFTKKLKCNYTLVESWELGKRIPSPRYLVKIADVVGEPVEVFFKQESTSDISPKETDK